MRTKLFCKLFLFSSIIASIFCGSTPVNAASFNTTRSSSKVAPGASLQAADINQDGKVQATDYVKVRNHIMSKSTIEQN